jgi:hypothetical protein
MEAFHKRYFDTKALRLPGAIRTAIINLSTVKGFAGLIVPE